MFLFTMFLMGPPKKSADDKVEAAYDNAAYENGLPTLNGGTPAVPAVESSRL